MNATRLGEFIFAALLIELTPGPNMTYIAALTANFAPQAVSGVKTDASGLLSDLHGDAEYRAHLVGVMALRAVEASA